MLVDWLKKISGVILAFALVFGAAAIPAVYVTAEAAATVQSTGFEGSTGTVTGSSTAATVTAEQAASGSHSLKIAPTGGLNSYKCFAICDDGTSKIKVKSNTRYKISLKYKIGAMASRNLAGGESPVTIEMISSGDANVWADPKECSDGKTVVYSKELKSVEWTRHDYIFTTKTVSQNLVISVYAKSGDVIYIDDIVLTELGTADDGDIRTFNFAESYPNFASVSDNAVPNYNIGASQTGWTLDRGYLHFPTTNKTKPGISSDNWVQHFGIYDSEFWIPDTDTTYKVKVKLRYNAANVSDSGYFSIASKTGKNMASGTLRAFDILEINGANSDWQIYEMTVNTVGLAEGKALFMTFGSSSGSGSFDVEYLKVSLFDSTVYNFSEDYSGWKRIVDGNDNGGVYASSAVAWDIDPDKNILHFPTNSITNPELFSDEALQKFSLYNGSYCKLKENTEYRITVRYKQVCTSPSKVGYFGLGYETDGNPEK